MKMLLLLSLSLLLPVYGCISEGQGEGDIEIFRSTPVWEIAKAIEQDNSDKIRDLLKDPQYAINYQEPLYGQTLIEWAVTHDRYNSTEELLKNGANPNIKNNHDGTSALIEAAKKKDSKFLTLLLSSGGDPNYLNFPETVKNFPLTTPLIAASNNSLENVKILVEAKADINYRTPKGKGNTALKQAALSSKVYIVKYLLIEKKAEFNYVFMKSINDKELYLVDYMRSWTFPINSNEWKCKMEIVDFLKQNNMDYKSSKIPKNVLKSYPKDYLDKY